MLLDWVTARVPYERLSPEALEVALGWGDRILRVNASTGEQVWETAAWDSIRSDSHSINIRAGGAEFQIQGSPARVIGRGDAVFGAGASRDLNIAGAVDRMRLFVGQHLGCKLPEPNAWIVTRVDVTENLLLDDLPAVRAALLILRSCEGGRYRVNQQTGDTVYWAKGSRLRRGKAYAKGPHLRYLMGKKEYEGCRYSEAEIALADRLLRLEATLAREWFNRHDWKAVTPAMLRDEWKSYFERMIGDSEMSVCTLKERIFAAAPTEGQGRAALALWTLIQSQGWENARELQSRTTWYRNLKILRAAGLGDADISLGQVVPLRKKVLESRVVTDWSELRSA